MRTEIDLDAASQSGITDEHTAITLRNFQASLDEEPAATSEKFVLFGGYADLVTGIGLALVMGSAWLVMLAKEPFFLPPLVAFLSFHIASRIDMRARPAVATVLMIAFMLNSAMSLPMLLNATNELRGLDAKVVVTIVMVTALRFWVLYWLRFRFPPMLGVGTLMVSMSAITAATQYGGATDQDLSRFVALFCAVATLGWAIWWDMTDVRRETERSQTAFWLHCSAGFLVNRSLYALLTGSKVIEGDLILTGLDLSHFPYVLAMVAGAAVISLALDRRSLLVGVLLPLVGMFENLDHGGTGAAAGMALAGSGLLFFSWTWLRLRIVLLEALPRRIVAQLPRTDVFQLGQRPTRRHLPLWPNRHDAQ